MLDQLDNIFVSCDLKSREIYLFGDSDNELEHRTAFAFLQNLRKLEDENEKPIIIHANTVGGSCLDGQVIFDSIKHSPCYIVYVMHGNALSMGSVLPQAADLRIIMPHALMMIHNVTPGLNDTLTVRQVEESVIIDKYFFSDMLNIYAERCSNSKYFKDLGYSISKVRAYIKRKIDSKHDWWLKAEEALEMGFVDEILGEGSKYKTLKDLRTLI